ncbi:MAG TPA: sodium:proton antiporter [Rhizomicrobium sp.]|nr:sodium:proton antiporter [Rhizomicrobium sp.]
MDVVIGQTLALMVIAIFVAIVARRLSLPYTVGLVLAGAALAVSRYDTGIHLTHDIIFDIILPPLLFEAAINIPWHELRRDVIPVLVLSIFGVVISALVVSLGMTWFLGWPFASALVFGVLIAATDPVAVIAMFKDTGLGGRLRLLVESESLFNDGVAAVLFGLALVWAQGQTGSTLHAGWALVTIAGGGVVLGLAMGGLGILVAGRTGDHMVEAAVTGVGAYGAFLAAEHLHVSGVLATVSAGLLMGSVGIRGSAAKFGLSVQGRAFVLEMWEFAAFIANSLVFLLIGLAVAHVSFEQVGWGALAAAVALVLVGRAATVYPLSLLFARSRWKIPVPEQHVLWWGGLRGALALALALALPSNLPLRNEIVIASFAVVAFSVLIQGLTMTPFMRRLGLLSSSG